MTNVTSDTFFEQEREQLHRNLLSSVSHDLKTPLSCIIGSLEIYERTKNKLSSDKRNALINTALHEAYRLDSFVTNILDMARFEANAVKLSKEHCIMNLLIEDCLTLFDRRLHECTLNIQVSPDPFYFTTDPLLLMRALCILLDNAVQYGPKHPVIDINYYRNEDQVVIQVQDNGPGIHESQQDEIFSKFTRLAKQDHKRAGTGLGLSICREIMRLLGGTVSVANRTDGNGAIFILSFAA